MIPWWVLTCPRHHSKTAGELFSPLSLPHYDRNLRQAGMDELQEEFPQAVDYLRGIDLTLWATPHLPGKRYGHNTSNVVEIMNSWIIEERKLSIIDMLHPLWCKNMGLRFRHLQEAKYNQVAAVVLTEHAVKLLEKSMQFSNHRLVRFADPNCAFVPS